MKGGVGSMEESFNTALVRGAAFIAFDNIRGKFNSPAVESFLTEDTYSARIPHVAAMNIDARRIMVFMTSNQAEITVDMANRCSCIRIRKRKGYRFREYPEGDLEQHILANQPQYLAAVFAIVRHWYACGKPSTKNIQHDFRVWAGIMDWVVQNIFDAGPLLEGHRDAQARMASPHLSWMRSLCLAVRDQGHLSEPLRTSDLVEIASVVPDVSIPGLHADADLADPDVKKIVLQAMGRQLGQCFKDSDELSIDSFTVTKLEDRDPDNRHVTKLYLFKEARAKDPGRAYAPPTDEPPIGAVDGSAPPPDGSSAVNGPACAYGAPMAAPIAAPMKPQCAPNAPNDSSKAPEDLSNMGLFDKSAVLVSNIKRDIESHRRIGADRRKPQLTEILRPTGMSAKAWATELQRLANAHASTDPDKAIECWRRAQEVAADDSPLK
jgi:hypothetical protein